MPTESNKPATNIADSSMSNGMQSTPIPGTVPSQPASNAPNSSLPVAATAEDVKERCPPKAMVKPQVLTHIIDGYIIQECVEPFPIVRGALMGEYSKQSSTEKDQAEEPPRKFPFDSQDFKCLGSYEGTFW